MNIARRLLSSCGASGKMWASNNLGFKLSRQFSNVEVKQNNETSIHIDINNEQARYPSQYNDVPGILLRSKTKKVLLTGNYILESN